MEALKNLNIQSTGNAELEEALQHKIDRKTKPIGSLGQMERIAAQVGLIQQTLSPKLCKPVMLTVASDHWITDEGVSPVSTNITWQQVLNFIGGGGGIGLFCDVYGFDLYVVDAGVNYDFPEHPKLIDKKVRKGTRNFLHEHAMTDEECNQAIQNGRDVVRSFAQKGSNVVAFGEMGIGNTSPATALLSVFSSTPVETCTGPGCGLSPDGVVNKAAVLKQAIAKHGIADKPEDNLARFGGLEIATIAGGMLEAAAQRMLIVVDGFITSSAFMAAYEICSTVKEYAVFAHSSKENGHKLMLGHMKAEAIMDLDLRLGEGTGAAVAYPIIQGSVEMLNRMTTFDETEVEDTTSVKYIEK
ncbi:nicotinate-nucleotide--dimethylbenzimidazole phosphoribosyltransferase [Saccharicrinis fermentans]|uniref:Nicotinate-nucleotide--dimethylbenzimidazole phosphoribosyltransferase n=1 Tax=Saccharicrinis fermentans DSM 9555 = JCM 21142 TaxID=869213 RepID=W7Y2C3_9BACT|nr:nicotinate-nucleotide--dimethylbenzimidazole phosphoribosyltransferase [Saccharicrinis fermentans]GAF02087.1 nicotinate-nucleotide-dimethylbenzimidazole phosphoribosyltransferase [Saccharicrinis fermentans DSM 9555 = JCM 21142]